MYFQKIQNNAVFRSILPKYIIIWQTFSKYTVISKVILRYQETIPNPRTSNYTGYCKTFGINFAYYWKMLKYAIFITTDVRKILWFLTYYVLKHFFLNWVPILQLFYLEGYVTEIWHTNKT